MKDIKTIFTDNVDATVLVAFNFAVLALLNVSVLAIMQFWFVRMGFTFFIHFAAATILVSIIILIAIRKIDECFPSVRELDLIIEGCLVIGLIGTVMALVIGFDKLNALKSSELSVSTVIGIINEGLFSTGIGLCLSFSAWLIKHRFLPTELLQQSTPCTEQLQKESAADKNITEA